MYSDLADYDFSPGAKLPRFKEKHPIIEIDLQDDNYEEEEGILPIFIDSTVEDEEE